MASRVWRQLRTLLWKNFRCTVKHPYKLALFYLFPLAISGFLLLISGLINKVNQDCDYQTIVLPPAHPILVVASLICSKGVSTCADRSKGYQDPQRYLEQLRTGEASAHRNHSRLCPQLTANETQEAIGRTLFSTCMERPKAMIYKMVSPIDFIFRGHVLYYPQSDDADQIMDKMATYLDDIELLKLGVVMYGSALTELAPTLKRGLAQLGQAVVCYKSLRNRTRGFASRKEAIAYAHSLNFTKGEAVWAIVALEDVGPDFRYTLIPHFFLRETVSSVVLQSLLETVVVERLTGRRLETDVAEKLLPRRCHKDPMFYGSYFGVCQLLLTMGVLPVAHYLVCQMSAEKAAGLLEFLFIAGVRRNTVRISWLAVGLLIVPTVTIFIGVLIAGIDAALLEWTSMSLFFSILLLYGLAIVALCFLVAAAMPTPQRAGLTIIVLFIAAWLTPGWAQIFPNVGYDENILVVRLFSMAHCGVSVQLALAYIFEWEKLSVGASWCNWAQSPMRSDRFYGVFEAMLHLVLQVGFYSLLTVYFDMTTSSTYGSHLPWYFPVSPAYWKGVLRQASDKKQSIISMGKDNDTDIEMMVSDGDKVPGIVLKNLTKRYGGKDLALDHVSMVLYQKEITALLGHNGAGKSTTMNILTGMLMPSSGTALIDGKDITTDMTEIRKNIGFCPQYDIIYVDLTPEEHIRFYGELKGLSATEYIDYSNHLFEAMQMDKSSLRTAVANLSGGVKRKLSITIAFLGNPSTVILDEPTSAIDPFSRRAIWDVILSHRHQITCLISTHYMQEADVLGNRIAIINHGQLKCVGTPMYLKAKYGAGFFLKLSHTQPIDSADLELKLRQFIPLIGVVSSNAKETTMSVPLDSARSAMMIDAFKYLEESGLSTHGVDTFGISESTMEQVFFNVAVEDETFDEPGHKPGSTLQLDDGKDNTAKLDSTNGQSNSAVNVSALAPELPEKKTGVELLLMQFCAVVVKRFHLARRSKAAFIFQMVMPLMFAAILLFLDGAIKKIGLGGEPLEIHLWRHEMKAPTMFYSGPDNSAVISSWLKYGIGTKCTTDSDITQHGVCKRNGIPLLPNETKDIEGEMSCQCKQCSSLANTRANAKSVQLQTNDTLLNLSNRNLTNFLLRSRADLVGGIEHIDAKQFVRKSLIPPFDFSSFGSTNIFGALSGMIFKAGGDNQANGTKSTAMGGFDMESIQKLMSRSGEYLALLRKSAERPMNVLWTGVQQPLEQRQPTTREIDMRYTPMAFLNGYFNILLRAGVSEGTGNMTAADYRITMTSEEVSMAAEEFSMAAAFSAGMLGMFSAIALILPTFNALMMATNERVSGNKQLQYLMGLNATVYWAANFLWDTMLYVCSVTLVVCFMYLFPEVFRQDLLLYCCCALAFGVSMILASYVMSLCLGQAHTAIMLEFIFTPFFTVAAIVLYYFRTKDWHLTAENVGLFFPPYFIGDSLMVISIRDLLPNPEPVFSWNVLGKRFALNSLWSLTMVVILVCFESGLVDALRCGGFDCTRRAAGGGRDETKGDADVKEEEERLAAELSAPFDAQSKTNVAVCQLTKVFGGKAVVDHVSFGVRRGECFGLLGVNGAGKTTLFKLLTGFHRRNAGWGQLMGNRLFSRVGGRACPTKSVSYCPQENVLLGNMTAAEHLHYYGRLRGITAGDRRLAVESVIRDVGLTPYVQKKSQQLSGGNKRKLNFAIAIMDAPELVLLDEMTTGMDPKARKAAWQQLREAVRRRGCAVIVTSHSMEECEQLCHRLVIMVNGAFRCIGGVQYLKDKFGNNYSVKFRLGVEDQSESETIFTRLRDTFPGCETSEQHLGYLEVKIPAASLTLSRLYETIHGMKTDLHIEDFSVSQTTLEHVFVNMVKEQA